MLDLITWYPPGCRHWQRQQCLYSCVSLQIIHTLSSSGKWLGCSLHTLSSRGKWLGCSLHTLSSSGKWLGCSLHTLSNTGKWLGCSLHTLSSSGKWLGCSLHTLSSSGKWLGCSLPISRPWYLLDRDGVASRFGSCVASIYSVTCTQRPSNESNRSGFLQWVVFKCRFHQIDIRRGLIIIITVVSLPFPKQQILDSSKLKEFADNNFTFYKNGRKFFKWVENTVGKGEIAHYEQYAVLKHAPCTGRCRLGGQIRIKQANMFSMSLTFIYSLYSIVQIWWKWQTVHPNR